MLAFLPRALFVVIRSTPAEYVVTPIEVDGWATIARSLAESHGYALPVAGDLGHLPRWTHRVTAEPTNALPVTGDRTHLPTALRPPVYPLVLAAWYRLAGVDPARALWFQVLLSSLIAPLLYRFSSALSGSRSVGLVAALIWCVQYKEFEMDLRLWSEPLLALLLLAALVAWRGTLGRAERLAASGRGAGSLAASFVAGLVLGLAAICRPEAALLVPVFVLVTLLPARRESRRPRHAVRLLGAWLLGAALPLALWIARNAVIFDAFVPADTNAGLNLYLGTLGVGYRDSTDFPQETRAALAGLGEIPRDAELRRRALLEIRREPARYASLCAKRAVLFMFNVHDPQRSFVPSPRSLALGLPFYALAFAGAAVLWGRGAWREVLLVAGSTAAGGAAHALTISSLRAMSPYLPLLTLLAAAGVVALISRAVPGTAR